MRSIVLRNVKAFENSERVEIAPITIFVGKNSCGKSSLIRFPAVLAQTIRSGFDSPITLHGQQENYIDYGNFESVLHKHNGKAASNSFSIELEYPIDLSEILDEIVLSINRGRLFRKKLVLSPDSARIIITYSKPEKTVKSREEGNSKKQREADPGNRVFATKVELYINDTRISRFEKKGSTREYTFTQEFTIQNGKIVKVSDYTYDIKTRSIKNFMPEFSDREITIALCNKHGISDNDKQYEIFRKIIMPSRKRTISQSESQDEEDNISAKSLSPEEKIISEEYEAFNVSARILSQLYEQIREDCLRTHYIGPFRLDPERVYRKEEIERSDVGIKGGFTSSLLINDSQNKNEILSSVSAWFNEAMHNTIEVQEVGKDSGYYQLCVSDGNNIDNLIDVGFGISQALPIVTQMAMSIQRSINMSESAKKDKLYPEVVIIEQPELHLHPAAQSELASLFVSAIDHAAGIDRKILIETHSEHFIRALQVIIADPDKRLTKDMVKVYYVDKDKNGDSYIKEMRMNEFGQFEEPWPSGFFDRAYDLSMELLDAGARRRNSHKEGDHCAEI